MNVRKDPCDECAFSRSCAPGLLGGSPVETYIGQALGPFRVPCHKACDFRDPEWKDKAFETLQCAGLAIYRTHIGVAETMPASLPCLPASPDVFSTPAEFMAHHKGISVARAQLALVVKPPMAHLMDQLQRPDNKIRVEPKP